MGPFLQRAGTEILRNRKDLYLHCQNISSITYNNVIHGGFGSTWGQNFYMDMQNGSKLEV